MKFFKFDCIAPKLAQDVSPLTGTCSWKPVYNDANRPSHRSQHAVCICGKYMYLYGGRGVRGTLCDFWKLNIITHEWMKIKLSTDKLPPLEGHSIVEYNDKLYIFGGEMSFARANEVSLWIFDPQTGRFLKKSHAAVAPSGRREHVSVLYGGQMCVYGGYVDLKGPSEDLWMYNIKLDAWKNIPEATAEPHPSGRYKHAACVYQNFMWMCGGLVGVSDSNPMQVWRWNFVTYTWCQIRTKGAPLHLSCHALCLVDNEVFVYGGNRYDGEPCSKLWKVNIEGIGFCGVQNWQICHLPNKVKPSPSCNHCFIALPDLSEKQLPCTSVENTRDNMHIDSSFKVSSDSTLSILQSCEQQSDMELTSNQLNLSVADTDTAERGLTLLEESSGGNNGFEMHNENEALLSNNFGDVCQRKHSRKGYFNYAAWNSYSNGICEMQRVQRFSYNLSEAEYSWKQNTATKDKFHASFKNIEPSAGKTVTLLSNYSKVAYETDLGVEEKKSLLVLKSSFLKNANILDEAEENLEGRSSPSNQNTEEKTVCIPGKVSSLLLLGGKLGGSSIHIDRPLSMWNCYLSL